jgi:hypothetical protein
MQHAPLPLPRQVRKAALCRISEAQLQCLTVKQRVLVLRHGLGDRDPGVKDTAVQVAARKPLARWLPGAAGTVSCTCLCFAWGREGFAGEVAGR